MKEAKTKILILDDDEDDIFFITNQLERSAISFVTEVAKSIQEFEKALLNFKPDIILSDYNLPGFNGLAAFQLKEKLAPYTPFIMVSGVIGEDNAIELIKSGVTDYVLKNKLSSLPFKVRRALTEANARHEKLKVQQELKRSEKRLADAQHIAHMGSWELELNTGCVNWSNEMFKIYNCNPETFTPTEASFIKLCPQNVQQALKYSFSKLKEGVKQPNLEFCIKGADEKVKYVEMHFEIVFDENEQPIKVIGISQDITERKLMENDLKRAKEQAEKGKALQEQFLANMSHEIRTPMNAIVGFSKLLKSDSLTKKGSEYITKINIASENLLVMINNLLDLSKIESGMMQLDKTVVHLPSLLESVFSMLQGNAVNKNLELSLSHVAVPEYIMCDPTRLSQILINITNNAIKFTEKGYVKIRAELSGKNTQKNYIKFIISDSGIGIAKENCELVFERFQQEHSDTTRKYGGSGLGLNIVKNIVRLMNGQISIESELGKGTQFFVLIPLEQCTTQQITEYINSQEKLNTSSEIKLGKLKILVAEDNRMNQEYVSMVMEEFGFDSMIACNGIDAIQKLKEDSFDYILMDIQMPEMDGYTATRIIRNELKINTPIIALTANAGHKEHENCIKAGMNGYISKPFKPEELYNKIAELESKGKNADITGKRLEMNTVDELESVFDIELLKKQMNGKLSSVTSLLKIFMEVIPRDIIALEDVIKKEDFPMIKSISHNMVSSFSVMGIESAIKSLKEIELNASQESEIMAIKSQFNELKKIIDKILSEIKELNFTEIPS